MTETYPLRSGREEHIGSVGREGWEGYSSGVSKGGVFWSLKDGET